jgi:hypothetical protein
MDVKLPIFNNHNGNIFQHEDQLNWLNLFSTCLCMFCTIYLSSIQIRGAIHYIIKKITFTLPPNMLFLMNEYVIFMKSNKKVMSLETYYRALTNMMITE